MPSCALVCVGLARRHSYSFFSLLVFRDLPRPLPLAAHVDFASTFGAPEPHPIVAGLPDAPEVLEIVKEAGEVTRFGETWHSDNSYMARPTSASILHGAEVRAARAPRRSVGVPAPSADTKAGDERTEAGGERNETKKKPLAGRTATGERTATRRPRHATASPSRLPPPRAAAGAGVGQRHGVRVHVPRV